MAGYKDDQYAQVDQQFATMTAAKDHFADLPLEDPTPFEQPFTPIQPSAWVENSDPDTDGGASVTIDSDGIRILNGKIFLEDPGGNTVLSPAGFGGSWIGFLADGFYNSIFEFGTLGVVAESIVSGADSIADYEASLSSTLPYWVVEYFSSPTTMPELISDSAAAGGRALKFVGATGSAKVFQDVPITPGRLYALMLSWKYDGTPDNFTRFVSASYRDNTHAIIGSEIETGLAFSTDQATYVDGEILSLGLAVAPPSAKYIRVGLEFDLAGNAFATLNSMRLIPQIIEGIDQISFGSNDDIVLDLDTGRLKMTGGALYINVTTDAELTGGGGLIIGNLTGANLVMDGNEIMARSNGANADILIQNDGGVSHFGGSIESTGSVIANLGGTGQITLSGNGYIILEERTDPGAADANTTRIYARDNGAGKTQIRAQFSSGGAQTIVTQA